MKTYKLILLFYLLLSTTAFSQSILDDYLNNYDYERRKVMKISNEQLVSLISNDSAVLVDIRFKEEQLAWAMDYALKIPLNELPNRFSELDKEKLIITACPHKDRAIIAMMYLKSKGYKVAYLKDGLLGLADYLRGDKAKTFNEKLKTVD